MSGSSSHLELPSANVHGSVAAPGERKTRYNDLFLTLTPGIRDAQFAWTIELKYLKSYATDADKAKTFEQAETQLRKYASDQHLVPMLTRGLQTKAGTLLFVGCAKWNGGSG